MFTAYVTYIRAPQVPVIEDVDQHLFFLSTQTNAG